MGFIDEDALANATSLDANKPPMLSQQRATELGKGFQKFPTIVYRHPKNHYKVVKHKDMHGNFNEETVANEHLTKTVNSEDELKDAFKSGWRKDPFVAPPLKVEDSEEYESAPAPQEAKEVDLDGMSKAQLIEYASDIGITLNPTLTKADLIAQIQAA